MHMHVSFTKKHVVMARMRQLKIQRSITNRDSESLDKYLQEIGDIPLIDAEKEIELAKKIKAGDEEALRQMAQANLRFVVSVAKQYQNQGLSLPDLINEGNLGLIKAAGRFDETRGFKFISYAVWWIRQSILQALAEQSRVVRLPLNQIGKLNKVNKAFARLEQEYERTPTNVELAELLDLPEESIEQALTMHSGKHASLDAPIQEGSHTLLDTLNSDTKATDESLMDQSMHEEVARALRILTERERDVIKLYFGINQHHGLTLEEIGVKFDLTRERVRQIKEKAIRRLKHSHRNKRFLRLHLGQ